MVDVALRNRGRTAALVVAFVLLFTTVAFAAGVKAADTSVPAVFIASGENYPDGLVSGSAAAVSGGPILLVTKDGIPAETAAELVRLNPDKIYIAGGTAVISAAVETQLAAYAPVVTRLSGSNRYATAAAISAAIFPTDFLGGVPGPAGPAGPAGADGTDGAPGADGTDGTDGLPGADGTDGAPGADGADGLPGADGTDGAPGADGTDGLPGLNGSDGVSGLEIVTVSKRFIDAAIGDNLFVVAQCPSGKKVTGGGGFVSGPGVVGGDAELNISYPATVVSWEVAWTANKALSFQVSAYAICAIAP